MNHTTKIKFSEADCRLFKVCRIITICAMGIALLATGCAKNNDARPPQAGIPVKTGLATQKDVPINVSSIGTVKAYSVVSITSHVDGQITHINVKEGQTVKKGEVLLNIDDRPYKTALESAKANLAKDRIQLEKAKKDAERYAELFKKDYVTKDQVEQTQTNMDALEAAIKGDEAVVQNAQLNLSYCIVTSPITGRAGSILVNEGNLIKGNDNSRPLMVINQIQPVFVEFSVPEQQLMNIQKQSKDIASPLEVQCYRPEKPDDIKKGQLSFIDNSIDSTTGTINLKALFENSDNSLWPGLFVNVVMLLDVQKDAIVVPTAAVQTGQKGDYIYVVKNDSTVDYRDVITGSSTDSFTVVEKGVSTGETVVTDGQLKLAPGSKITVKTDTNTDTGAKQ
jgi:membrane fusion protein, multidrug efflux system